MDMNMDPMQYASEYGNVAGFAGAGMASSYYRWPKGIIPYRYDNGPIAYISVMQQPSSLKIP